MKPIYHLHIRKTGGTTINHALLAALTGMPSEPIYGDLAKADGNRLSVGGTPFAGWSAATINAGGWDFAFGHKPIEDLVLPNDAMVITCFRDPVARLASHYRMLREMIAEGSDHVIMAKEAPWASGSFRDFVDAVPDKHRLTQLYMFSAALDLAEASERLKRVDHILWTESLSNGLDALGVSLGLPIDAGLHMRPSRPLEIPASELAYAKEALALEYDWLASFSHPSLRAAISNEGRSAQY